jgi:hypothetical protein
MLITSYMRGCCQRIYVYDNVESLGNHAVTRKNKHQPNSSVEIELLDLNPSKKRSTP